MFRKQKDSDGEQKTPAGAATGEGAQATNKTAEKATGAPPLKPFSKNGSHTPAKPTRPETPRRTIDIPGPGRFNEPGARRDSGRIDDGGRRLTVGSEIRLKGEITSCDTLVVEGEVEVSLSGARVIEVSKTGFFRGDAEVDEADISGRYEGQLIARDKLTVRAGGRISGSIRYGRIVIESGGEISGDMQSLGSQGSGDAGN